MKHSEALGHIRTLRRVIQRAQTNLRDPLVGYPEDDPLHHAAALLMPWIFGPTSLLDVLLKIEDMADNGAAMTPLDFYNVMTIAHRLQPQLAALPALLMQGDDLPPPDIEWMRGWEVEG